MTARARFSTLVGLLAVAAAIVLVSVNHRWLMESWHLRGLDSEDEETRRSARAALIGMRSERVVPILLNTEVQNSAAEMQEDLAGAREILSTLESPSFAKLTRWLDEAEPQIFLNALLVHAEARSEADVRAALLVSSLSSSTAGIRRFAAEKLSRLGVEVPGAVAALKKAQSDESEDVRFWAKLALQSLEFRDS